jgi:hypothetical protein
VEKVLIAMLELLAVQAQAVQQQLVALGQQTKAMRAAMAMGLEQALMLAVAVVLGKLARLAMCQRVAMVWPALSLVAL